jgi:hypothetical protein
MNEIQTGAANAQASAQVDQNSSTAHISSGSGEGQPGHAHEGHELPTPAGATKSSGRRGLAAALLGATAAIALLPKKAAADLSFGDVQGAVRNALRAVVRPLLEAIQNILGDIFDFLRKLFEWIVYGLPESIRILLDWLADLLGWAGEDSYTNPETIAGAIERSYPEEAPSTPSHVWHVLYEVQGPAIRARVQEAIQITAAAAREQRGIVGDAEGIIAAANATGSVVALIAANNALLGILAGQNAAIIAGQAAITSLIADQTIKHATDASWGVQRMVDFLGEAPYDVRPTDRLPGVPD